MPMLASDPYETGVLDRHVHARLVADITNIARDAAIQAKWIWMPLADTVSPTEVDWVKKFHLHTAQGKTGFCLVGEAKVSVEDRMSAIAGALLRNFVRARVFTIGQLLERTADRDTTSATCLLVPNFFLGKAQGGHIPDWKVSLVYDLLLERHLSGRQTVIYVASMKALAVEYGAAIAKHINTNFHVLEG